MTQISDWLFRLPPIQWSAKRLMQFMVERHLKRLEAFVDAKWDSLTDEEKDFVEDHIRRVGKTVGVDVLKEQAS